MKSTCFKIRLKNFQCYKTKYLLQTITCESVFFLEIEAISQRKSILTLYYYKLDKVFMKPTIENSFKTKT